VPKIFRRSIPKYANADNKKNDAAPSSRFPIKGIMSGINSKTPNPGFTKYKKEIIPINPTNVDFSFRFVI